MPSDVEQLHAELVRSGSVLLSPPTRYLDELHAVGALWVVHVNAGVEHRRTRLVAAHRWQRAIAGVIELLGDELLERQTPPRFAARDVTCRPAGDRDLERFRDG